MDDAERDSVEIGAIEVAMCWRDHCEVLRQRIRCKLGDAAMNWRLAA